MNLEGRCACRTIRYRLTASPLIVHACHCRDCQRLTGGPFAINLWVQRRFVESNSATPKSYRLAGGTGKYHDVFFCETCGTTLWSRYDIVPSDCLFVRATARLTLWKQSGRTFTYIRAARCRGWICPKVCRHSNRAIGSTTSGR
jgi:hypothetical protein